MAAGRVLKDKVNMKHFIFRCIALNKVLWFGIPWLRGVFVALACLWCLVALVASVTASIPAVAIAMAVPYMLQIILVMSISMRSGQLLVNSQLHLMGIRKELFVNSLVLCLLTMLFVFDPKSSDNVVNAKLITFAFSSVGFFWMFWLYCLQLLSMAIVALITVVSVGLIFVIGVKPALLIFSVASWAYFAFWLSRSSIQRQFKFESFAGIVEYCVERLSLAGIKRALIKVNCREHVVLIGEGDGYLNRIILAPFFTLIFTGFYVLALKSARELCLWMILMILGGTKAKMKVVQSQAKLWLLHDSNRVGQFSITEHILIRLAFYSFFPASVLLAAWCYINPELVVYGLGALCLGFLLVVLFDYYAGFIYQSAKVPAVALVFVKMALLFVLAQVHLSVGWYLVIAAVLLGLIIIARSRAKNNFLVGNLSVRV